MLETFFSSLLGIFEPITLVTMLAGIAIGFAVGILPGLGGSVSLALMLPFTIAMEPVQAFAFLLGMYVVCATTGDITSVLFGVPGEATTAATVLDGYPLTKQGQAGRALGGALLSSAMGAVLGAIVLALSVPIMRPLVLALGPPEFFMLTILGLSFVIALSGRDIFKGLIMAAVGFIVSMVGLDPQAGIPRYVFGSLYLWDGVSIVAVVVGLFGGAELLQLMLSKASISRKETADPYAGLGRGLRDCFRHWTVVVRSSAIGILIGVIPGMGGSVSQFIAYGSAQQASKHPEKFGKGSMEGLVAAGANNNAKDSGALIPTIAFGIPGSVSMAVLLSAFVIVGLQPGPEMLSTHLDVTFSMVWIMVVANIIAVVLSLLLLKQLVKLSFLKGTWLAPFLLVLLSIGAFTAHNTWQDVVVMLTAAAFGVVCIHWDWPRVPFLLAFVLGHTAERYLFLSNSLHGWTWLQEPVVIGLALMTVLVIAGPYIRRARTRRAAERAEQAQRAGVAQ